MKRLDQGIAGALVCSILAFGTLSHASAAVDREQVRLIADSQRANMRLLGGLDLRYTVQFTDRLPDGTRKTWQKEGRYAHQSRQSHRDRVLTDERSSDGSGIKFVQTESQTFSRNVWKGVDSALVEVAGAASDKVKPGMLPPWKVPDGGLGLELDDQSGKFTVSSTKRDTVGDEDCIRVDVTLYENVPDVGRVPIAVTVWYAESKAFLPLKYELDFSDAEGRFPPLREVGSVQKMAKYETPGGDVFLPLSFLREKTREGGTKTTRFQVDPESVRINPELPETLFSVEIAKADQVVNKDLGMTMQGAYGTGPRFVFADASSVDGAPLGLGELAGVGEIEGDSGEGDHHVRAQVYQIALGSGICLDVVYVPAGSANIGSPSEEVGYPPNIAARIKGTDRPSRPDTEQQPKQVAFPQGFYMGKYEVTVGQFSTFRADSPLPSGHQELKPDFPACVSWDDAVGFCDWLSGRVGVRVRLPFEVEWEYAARSSCAERFYWGQSSETISSYANVADREYEKQFPGRAYSFDASDGYSSIAPVGSFKPNAFGLYDMIGNVSEWCQDCFSEGYTQVPSGTEDRTGVTCERVVRGGSWQSDITTARCAARQRIPEAERNAFTGFRILLTSLPEHPVSKVGQEQAKQGNGVVDGSPARQPVEQPTALRRRLLAGISLGMVFAGLAIAFLLLRRRRRGGEPRR